MKYIGFLLLVFGLLLVPIGIGVFIFIGGLFILIFDFYKTWINRLVPEKVLEKVGDEIKKSYKPYTPVINSLKSMGGEMLKTSGFILIIITVVIIIRFSFGGNEDNWICDKNGSWIKHGNPAYPSPIVECNKTKYDCLGNDCNRKTIDRGNLCRDSDECEGTCLASQTEGGRYGQCSVWVVELGCKKNMKQGKIEVICID